MAEDELLKKIRQTREAQEKIDHNRSKAKSESRVERMSEDVNLFHRFIFQLIAGLQWSFVNVGIPTWKVVRWPFWKLVKQYRRLWSLIVYQRDEFENLRFSKTRAGVMFTATVVFLWFFMMPSIGLVFDTANYVLTAKHNEIVYLTQSQEIVANELNENIHSVKGATHLPFDPEDSFYLRINDSWFNQLWSIVYRGGLFYPDYVAAAVPGIPSKCVTTSYGFRMKGIMRHLEIYPHLLSATCQVGVN